MITLDRLKYFIAAAQTEHVGEAAKRLRISASVISSAIKEIESEVGSALFTRIGNRIQLNAAGRTALESSQRILEEVETLKQQAKHQTNQLQGQYRVGSSQLLSHRFLIPACLELQMKNPGLTFDFMTADTSQCIAHIKSGHLDGALVFRSSYSEKMSESILFADQFKIYVHKKHPVLNTKNPIKDLNSLPAVTFKAHLGGNFWQAHPAFGSLGLEPKHGYYYDDPSAAAFLLQKTNGWAFLPSLAGSAYPDLVEVKKIPKFSAPVNLSLISSESLRVQAFVGKLIFILKRAMSS